MQNSQYILFLIPIVLSPLASIASNKLEAIPRNRCELKLVADYEFYKVIGQRNYANAARYLINMIERVNGIFTSVDWGLDINGYRLVNLGFTIKEIKILERPEPRLRTHFNYESQIGGVDSMEMLDSFSSEEGTNSTCLTLLITAKALDGDRTVLGVANIGSFGDPSRGTIDRGICAREPENGTMYKNTAIVSVRRRQELMITRVVDLVTAHELGHAWGGTHDDIHDPECVPQNSRDGRFVMWESANTGYDKNNYNFSPCSVRSIHRMLYSLAHRCFVEEKSAMCGNGILEEGEECDSGAHLKAIGGEEDPCCTSKCRLRSRALCSPRHSECCSNNCTYLRAGKRCQKRSVETCKELSVCTGLSDKCPDPSPLQDGTSCTDEGSCRGGWCISFCSALSPDLLPCLCEDVPNACRRCCRSKESGVCAPVHSSRWLPEGSMCIHGQCHANVCEKKTTDISYLRRFFNNFKGPAGQKKFFSDYIVFIVVLITLFIWFPCGAFIVYKDQRKHKKLVERNVAARENVVVVPLRKRVARLQHRSETLNGNAPAATTLPTDEAAVRRMSRSANTLAVERPNSLTLDGRGRSTQRRGKNEQKRHAQRTIDFYAGKSGESSSATVSNGDEMVPLDGGEQQENAVITTDEPHVNL